MNEELRQYLINEFGEDVIKSFEEEVGSLTQFNDEKFKKFIAAKVQKIIKRSMKEIITTLDFSGMSMDVNLNSTLTSKVTGRAFDIDLTITEKINKNPIKPGVN